MSSASDLLSQARQKREQAERARRLGRGVTATADQARFADYAQQLDEEAERLEEAAARAGG
jgi:hypothetical protein